jgi:hypothetical protein
VIVRHHTSGTSAPERVTAPLRRADVTRALGINSQLRNRNVKPSRILIGGLLAVTAGCGDGTGPGGVSGSVSFSHSGATTGTFSASGSVLVADPQTATWAAGTRNDASQSIDVEGYVAHPSSTHDYVHVHFPQLTAGTVTVANDATVSIVFGQPQTGAATWYCTLTSGSVVLTSLSSARVRGSFSGSGSCLPSTGSPVAFTVTDGSFDVPLVDINDL